MSARSTRLVLARLQQAGRSFVSLIGHRSGATTGGRTHATGSQGRDQAQPQEGRDEGKPQ
jgi:hypothetical protein